jgi:polyhydroxyalkanoate synthesis regulator phasin
VAKKDAPRKGAGKDSDARKPTRSDAVRSAAAQAIEAAGQAGLTRERAHALADELTHAAGRVRDALDDLRPAGADELRALREHVAELEERVGKLEKALAKRPAPRRRTPPAKPPASS